MTTIAASSATAFRTSAPTLDDQGWTERLSEEASTVDEPEPWIGWANGAPRPAAPATTEDSGAVWRPVTPPSAAPAAEPAARLPSVATPAITEEAPPTPRPVHDVETRSALFTELRSVGHQPEVTPEPAAPPAADVPAASAEPTAEAPVPVAPEDEPPAPAQPISRSDVADLLRELHALSLDDE